MQPSPPWSAHKPKLWLASSHHLHTPLSSPVACRCMPPIRGRSTSAGQHMYSNQPYPKPPPDRRPMSWLQQPAIDIPLRSSSELSPICSPVAVQAGYASHTNTLQSTAACHATAQNCQTDSVSHFRPVAAWRLYASPSHMPASQTRQALSSRQPPPFAATQMSASRVQRSAAEPRRVLRSGHIPPFSAPDGSASRVQRPASRSCGVLSSGQTTPFAVSHVSASRVQRPASRSCEALSSGHTAPFAVSHVSASRVQRGASHPRQLLPSRPAPPFAALRTRMSLPRRFASHSRRALTSHHPRLFAALHTCSSSPQRLVSHTLRVLSSDHPPPFVDPPTCASTVQLPAEVAEVRQPTCMLSYRGSNRAEAEDFVRHFRSASAYIRGHRNTTFLVLIPGEVIMDKRILVRCCPVFSS
jgi:hypothetical protein